MATLAFALVSILLMVLHTNAAAINEFILKTTTLPTDLNFMPSLSNGHLGFTVFGDSIYINGVYNGYKGDSRRARLPNWLNISAKILRTDGTEPIPSDPAVYSMNLLEGYFEWKEHFNNSEMTMKQRVYAHRFYNRAIIFELAVRRNTSEETITIELQRYPGPGTTSFVVIPEMTNEDDDDITLVRATTLKVEDAQFQPNLTQLYVAFSEKLHNKTHLIFERGQKMLYYRFVMTADFSKQVALTELREVLKKPGDAILEEHTSIWRKFWNNFHIEVKHNLELSQIINAGIFYMASSLPSLKSFHRNNPYFGLSPTGLGRGRLNADYQGHNFWDCEIWMLPVVTQLHTSWSQQLFEYRLNHMDGALYNANLTGFKGARFPWESAYTGTDVTNPCCPEVATQEIHISADIAVALQQFYTTTHDRDWLCSAAWPLVREIATFLSSRTTFNNQTKQYHIKNVMGPDEDHENVDDNVYTNVAAKQAFQFACFTQMQCLSNTNQSCQKWFDKANNLVIVYDIERDFHPQDKDYQPGEEIKQADTILLGYPLQFSMANSTRFNDLSMYANVTRASGPAMTWSMFAINFLDIGMKHKADHYFIKGYQEYVRPEFKVWSETKQGYHGSANFLTGIGGFLQSIVNGYAGIRFQLDNNKSMMLINNPTTFPGTTEFNIKGIKFANSSFSLNVSRDGMNYLTCSQLGMHSLQYIRANQPSKQVFTGLTIQFKNESLSIQTI